jgi:hypothetical protein
MLNRAQCDPPFIGNNDWSALDLDTSGRTAIACEDDSATIMKVSYAFEELVPKVNINIRHLRFVENKHRFLALIPPFLDFKIIFPATLRS